MKPLKLKLLITGFIFFLFTSLYLPSAANAIWVSQNDMFWTHYNHESVSLGDNAFLAGGTYTTTATNHVQLFTNTGLVNLWETKANMNTIRTGFTMDTIEINGTKKVIVVGGSTSINTAELYDLENNKWTYTQNMNQGRNNHASSVINNNRILISGGGLYPHGPRYLNSAELYNPGSNIWTFVAPFNIIRSGHRQITFNDSNNKEKVMIIGGTTNGGPTTSTEIYDPESNEWTNGPNINHARTVFNALLLHDGRILIVGGRTGPANSISEVYSPETNTWTTYEIPYDSYDNQIVNLGPEANNKILLAGGSSGSSLGINRAALFDPITNTWTEIEGMNTPRANFSLTSIGNGSAIAAGGYNSISGRLKSSEIFTFGDVLGETAPPVPFLDLPWDYEGKNMSFQEAALAINSYFDHTYPVLGYPSLSESAGYENQVTTFRNKVENVWYSSHNGYDYGLSGGAKVAFGDNVLAAADGLAEYNNSCGPCGEMIVITHANGYQTKYMHLREESGLISVIPGAKIPVTKGQKIGEVGLTGNTDGAHIHFSVYQDKNGDGNVSDNFLDGLTDPFGWQSDDPDPWENYSFTFGGVEKTGNKSYYLWDTPIENPEIILTQEPNIIQTERFKFEFAQDTIINNSATLKLIPEPSYVSDILMSLGSTLKATAIGSNAEEIKDFNQPYTLTVDFSSIDIARYNINTLSIYSSEDGKIWDKETTEIDLNTGKAIAILDHLTYFALMGERSDIIAPTSTAHLVGLVGSESNWFRTNVGLSINSIDNEGGLGVQYTAISITNDSWSEYVSPLEFSDEGKHIIKFYSEDNDGNVEEIKSVEFNIDKTAPEAQISASKTVLWPPNGKLIPVVIDGQYFSEQNPIEKPLFVQDEYGEINYENVGFGDIVWLKASRKDDDLDGRKYTISVKDKAGNISKSKIVIVVPHDLRN